MRSWAVIDIPLCKNSGITLNIGGGALLPLLLALYVLKQVPWLHWDCFDYRSFIWS